MDIEIWKDIPEFEFKYQISSHGRVRSYKSSILRGEYFKILEPHIVTHGYLAAVFCTNKKLSHKLIHRLVAFAFCEGYFEGATVNHKDFNKRNNHYNNLEWLSSSDNVRHYHRFAPTQINTYYSVTNSKKCINLETGEMYNSIGEAAKSLGCSMPLLSRKLNGFKNNNTAIRFL